MKKLSTEAVPKAEMYRFSRLFEKLRLSPLFLNNKRLLFYMQFYNIPLYKNEKTRSREKFDLEKDR